MKRRRGLVERLMLVVVQLVLGGDTKDIEAAAAETKEENPGFGSSNTVINRQTPLFPV